MSIDKLFYPICYIIKFLHEIVWFDFTKEIYINVLLLLKKKIILIKKLFLMESEVKVGFQIKNKDRANLTLIAVNLSSVFF